MTFAGDEAGEGALPTGASYAASRAAAMRSFVYTASYPAPADS